MKHREHDFVRVKFDDLYIYSCCAAPNMTIPEYCKMLDRLTRDAKDRNPKIITDDFHTWAMEKTNERGRILLEVFSYLNVTLANIGGVNTFRRRELGSVVDLTSICDSLVNHLHWHVSEEYMHSDH